MQMMRTKKAEYVCVHMCVCMRVLQSNGQMLPWVTGLHLANLQGLGWPSLMPVTES